MLLLFPAAFAAIRRFLQLGADRLHPSQRVPQLRPRPVQPGRDCRRLLSCQLRDFPDRIALVIEQMNHSPVLGRESHDCREQLALLLRHIDGLISQRIFLQGSRPPEPGRGAEILTAVDGGPDKPGFFVLPVCKLRFFPEIAQKNLLVDIIGVLLIAQIGISQLMAK